MVLTLSYLFFPITWFLSLNDFDLIETKSQKGGGWGQGRQNRKEQKKRAKTQDLSQEDNSMFSIRPHILSNTTDWQIAYLVKMAKERIHTCGIMLHKQDFKQFQWWFRVSLSIHCGIQPNVTQTTLSSVSAFVGLRCRPFFTAADMPLTNLSWGRNGIQPIIFAGHLQVYSQGKIPYHLSCQIPNTHIGLNRLGFLCRT